MTEKEIVVPRQSNDSEAALGAVVVNRDPRVCQEQLEPLALIVGIRERLAERSLRKEVGPRAIGPGKEGIDQRLAPLRTQRLMRARAYDRPLSLQRRTNLVATNKSAKAKTMLT
jgi:hypothetical protein